MFRAAVSAALLLPALAVAQLQMGPRLSPGGAPVLDPPAPVTPTTAPTATDVLAPATNPSADATDILAGTAPVRSAGQRHWISVNFGSLQPTAARLGVKVWDRPNGSLWLEVYGGSALFDWMYGFGARMQFTAASFGNGDQVMVAPGFGAHILPTWEAATRRYYAGGWYGLGYYEYEYKRSPLYFLAADVDVSWLHDFSPRFGFELGMKIGLAGRVGGEVGKYYPRSFMFGRNFYPILSFYSGFRF